MEDIIGILMDFGSMEDRACSQEEREKILSEAKESYKKSLSKMVYEVFNHKTIQFIRNSQSDAEVRRYIINAYNNCK